jgi:hypothetical protein
MIIDMELWEYSFDFLEAFGTKLHALRKLMHPLLQIPGPLADDVVRKCE